MAKPEWLNEEDLKTTLSKDQRELLGAVGLEAFLALHEKHRGKTFYISSAPIWKAKCRYAVSRFDGKNAKVLARKLGVTHRTIYNWVRKDRQQRRQLQKRRAAA